VLAKAQARTRTAMKLERGTIEHQDQLCRLQNSIFVSTIRGLAAKVLKQKYADLSFKAFQDHFNDRTPE
jgi:hypothetical protein